MKKFISRKVATLHTYSRQLYQQMNSFTGIFQIFCLDFWENLVRIKILVIILHCTRSDNNTVILSLTVIVWWYNWMIRGCYKRKYKIKKNGTPSTKTHRDGLWCKQPSTCMEEVETDHAVILECCHEAEDRRRKILSVPVHNRRKRKRNLQHMVMEKTLGEHNQRTDEDNITMKLLMEKFEVYCLPKKNLVIEKKQ